MTDINGLRWTGKRRPGSSFAAIAEQLNAQIEEVAKRLLGEPNRALSTRAQLRFGRNGSVAVELDGNKRGQRFDHENKLGGGALDLVRRCTGLSGRAAAEWAATGFGVAAEQPLRPRRRRIAAAYDYRDETGVLLFQVVRYAPKTFRQRRPDGNGGWSWRVRGIRQVPYRLPELCAAGDAPVFVVEGEKDADRLASLGFVATCNAGGANKWPDALNRYFQGCAVCILPDNDDAGRAHAQKVAAALHRIADNLRVVTLPDLPPGGDVSDWLAAGGDGERLIELWQAASPWRPDESDAFADVPSYALLPYCEEALTLAFSARHADDLRYCDVFGRWFEWEAGRWREDLKRRVFTHARKLCRDRSAAAMRDIEDEKTAARIAANVASAKVVAAVVGLARADVRHATASEDWDADPWVLNTPVGIVELRSGAVRPHDRRALCSKMTAVAPTEAECPRWQRFLSEVTDGDVALQGFLARVAG